LVLLAKAVVAAVFSGLCAALMVLASVLVAKLTADPLAGSLLSVADMSTWRLVGAIALYAMLAAVLGVGVGALLRFSAGAVAVLLLWPLVAEPLLGNMPRTAPAIGPYLPFANAFRFLDVSWLYPVYDFPWGVVGSLLYFAVVVAVVFTAAIVVVNRRDA
jgi:ABC-2 type transport system permease protein